MRRMPARSGAIDIQKRRFDQTKIGYGYAWLT